MNWVTQARESLVVEIGAGTGQFSVEVAPECDRVIAVDVSPLMLSRLQAKVTALGLSNIELVRAGFLTYEHTGSRADFIYSRFALHHLPDFWKALALTRLRSMVAPDGVVRLWDVVYDFAPSEAEARIEAWCATGGDAVERGLLVGGPPSQSTIASPRKVACTPAMSMPRPLHGILMHAGIAHQRPARAPWHTHVVVPRPAPGEAAVGSRGGHPRGETAVLGYPFGVSRLEILAQPAKPSSRTSSRIPSRSSTPTIPAPRKKCVEGVVLGNRARSRSSTETPASPSRAVRAEPPTRAPTTITS